MKWFYCKDEFKQIEIRWDTENSRVRIIDWKNLSIVNEEGIPLVRVIKLLQL